MATVTTQTMETSFQLCHLTLHATLVLKPVSQASSLGKLFRMDSMRDTDVITSTHYYYYMSRFMFAFYLIALFFAVVAFFTGMLALCTRLGAYLSSLTTFMAFFFQALAASLMT